MPTQTEQWMEGQTEGQKNGETLLYRTLPANTWGPKSEHMHTIKSFKVWAFHSIGIFPALIWFIP